MSRPAPAPRSQPEQAWLRDLVPLRPQGPIEVVDRATHILRTRIRDLMAVSLAVNLPIWLVLAFVLRERWAAGLSDNPFWFWSSIIPAPFLFGTSGTGLDGPTWVFVVSRTLPSLGLAITGAATGALLASWASGRSMSGMEALIWVARRGHKILALWAVVHAIELVTVVGLFLGPFVFGVAAPLWAIEHGSVLGTIKRSWRLSIRQLVRTVSAIVVATFIAALVGGLLGGAPLLALYLIAGGWVDLGGTATVTLAGVLPHLVVDPLLALAVTLLALDLKVRGEGADLVDEISALATEPHAAV